MHFQNSRTEVIRLIFTGMIVLCAATAYAQSSRGGSQGQSSQAMAQLQQMAVERDALKSQLSRVKDELVAAQSVSQKAEGELGALRSRAARAEAKVQAAEAGRLAAEQASTKLQSRLDDVMGRLKSTVETLKTTDGERADVVERLAVMTRQRESCVEHNAALYLVTMEVLDRFEKVGLKTAMMRSEPFTRLARTRAENAADAYRDRIDSLREQQTSAAMGNAAPNHP